MSGETNCYNANELKIWWAAICPKCGWRGLTKDCDGGGQIADTGDYNEPLCPKCGYPVDDDYNIKVV